MDGVGPMPCEGFLVGGTCACVLMDGAGFPLFVLKRMTHFSGCLMSSDSIQKLFCEIYSALKCSFDEFVREKVVSSSYSSAILGPPLLIAIL